MADYDDPRPSSEPTGSTSGAVAKDDLITLDRVMTAPTGTEITNRKGEVLKPMVDVVGEASNLVQQAVDAVAADTIQNTDDIETLKNEMDAAESRLDDIEAENIVTVSDSALELTQTGEELQQAINDVESGNVGVYVSDGDVELTQTGSKLQATLDSSVGVSGSGGDLTQTLAELQAAVNAAEAITKPVVKNYLEGNSRWNVPYGDSPLPTSTAQTATSFSFFAGNRYCYGQPLVNHTLTGVVFDADSGVYHSFYPSSENMAGKFGAGVLLSDGSISNAGVTLYYEAGNSRNGVAVDMSLAPAHICPVLVPVADATTVTCAVVSEADSWNAAIKPVLLTNSGYTPVGDEPSDVRTDASLPANIANDSRYELTNPFGGNKCNVTVEILVRGVWTPTGQSEHSSLFTGLLAGVVGDKVVIQTALSTLRFDSSSQGSLDLTGYIGTGTVGSAPCRVWVEALRK